jgi:hypothetical protein
MGDLAIRIGAGTAEYNDIALAFSMRGNQKLSITGSGTDIKAAITDAAIIAKRRCSRKVDASQHYVWGRVAVYVRYRSTMNTKRDSC